MLRQTLKILQHLLQFMAFVVGVSPLPIYISLQSESGHFLMKKDHGYVFLSFMLNAKFNLVLVKTNFDSWLHGSFLLKVLFIHLLI